MTDETTTQEPIEEESAPQQEEGAPGQAAEPEVEEEPKELPDKKALREARRDAKKLERKLKRSQKELERARQFGQRLPARPPQGMDEQEALRQKAAAFDQMEQERFVTEELAKLGLDRDDKRIDMYSPLTFGLSAAAAKAEDLEEWEAELAEKEEKLESLGERLRAEAKEAIAQEMRDFRREAGLDAVARVTQAPGAGDVDAKVAAIDAEYAERLQLLKHSGQTAEAYRLLKEKEAKIEKVRAEQ